MSDSKNVVLYIIGCPFAFILQDFKVHILQVFDFVLKGNWSFIGREREKRKGK